MGGEDEMIKASIGLQDLRRRIYVRAKAEPAQRFWGLYVHVCKIETLREAYSMARRNSGAPGGDGETFEAIEERGVKPFLEQIRDELTQGSYRPMPNRRKGIPKEGGKLRILSIPSIRDRVVQGALKLILEPIFEADFQPGSYGYRPKRTAHQALQRVAKAIVKEKTRIVDIDLRAYFDGIRHHLLLGKIAARVDDSKVMALLKAILKASGRRGVPQGGPLSPLLSNVYLNDVDRMLEHMKEATRQGPHTYLEYVRWADDLVVLVDSFRRHNWMVPVLQRRLQEEFGKLEVDINEDKSRVVDLAKEESFSFLGFDFRRVRSLRGTYRPQYTPRMKNRTAILRKLKDIFRRFVSQPVDRLIPLINRVLRGWVNYFRVGHSSRCFGYIRDWVEKKIRRHMMRSRKQRGFGWKRWSRSWLYEGLGLFSKYEVISLSEATKALPAR